MREVVFQNTGVLWDQSSQRAVWIDHALQGSIGHQRLLRAGGIGRNLIGVKGDQNAFRGDIPDLEIDRIGSGAIWPLYITILPDALNALFG